MAARLAARGSELRVPSLLPQAPLVAGTLAKLVVVVSDASRTPVERHVIQPKVRGWWPGNHRRSALCSAACLFNPVPARTPAGAGRGTAAAARH